MATPTEMAAVNERFIFIFVFENVNICA